MSTCEQTILTSTPNKGIRNHRIVLWISGLILDKRFVMLYFCLFIGFLIKYIVFLWSVSVVELSYALFGIPSHGVSLGIGDHLVLEHYDDWAWFYVPFVDRFLQGYVLYTPELYEIVPGVQSYLYPPLFQYMLVFFYLLPGLYSMVGGIVFLDLFTGGVLFLAALRVTHNTNRASLAALFYFINPVAIWWTDFCWFGTSFFTFFMILGFLFLLEDRFYLASLFLALACMVKQVAAIFIPLLLILAYHKGWRTLLASLSILIITFVVLSLPYLVIMPAIYLDIVIGPAEPYLFFDVIPPWNIPAPLYASFWFLHAPIRNVIGLVVYTYVPLVFVLFIIYFVFLLSPESDTSRRRYHLVAAGLLLSLAFYTLFPRGLFKWYLVAIIPFFSLALACVPGPRQQENPDQPKDKPWWQRIPRQIGSKLAIAFILFLLASCALTWCHRWMGPGLLLLSLISYAVYWFFSGRYAAFPSPKHHQP